MQRASSVVNPENLKYSVEVSFVQFEKQTEEERLYKSIPPTGWATTAPPETVSESAYAASFFLILGIFFGFPWFLGSFYVFSKSKSAYLVGVLCFILSLSAIFICVISFLTIGQIPFFPMLTKFFK